jgi:putative transposase
VHLLLEVVTEPLSKFMQGLQQAYTQYFNRRHHKVGHLFQGRYHAIVCDKDEYLLTLVRYIHLNPVRAKMVKKPEQFSYSGHAEYCGSKKAEIIDPSLVLELLGGRKAYQRFVLDGIGEGHKEEYYEVEDQRFLGQEGFSDKIKTQLTTEEDFFRPRKPLSAMLGALAKGMGTDPAVLGGADRSWTVSRARTIVGYVLVRRLGYRLTEVAKSLGRDMATVSSSMSRLAERIQGDKQLQKKIHRLVKIVMN